MNIRKQFAVILILLLFVFLIPPVTFLSTYITSPLTVTLTFASLFLFFFFIIITIISYYYISVLVKSTYFQLVRFLIYIFCLLPSF